VLTVSEGIDRAMVIMACVEDVLNLWRVIRSVGRTGEVKGGPRGKILCNINLF
jgi:hypothetical protein